MARIPPRLLLVALLVLLPVACGSGDKEQEGQGKTLTLGAVTFADHGTRDVQGKGDTEVEADSTYFNPTFLRGTPGQTLTLTIANEAGTLHNFSVSAQQVDTDIPAKGKVTVTVRFPPAGALRFFCKYHTSQGMNGELLAGDATPQPVSEQAPATPTAASGPGYHYP